MAGKKVITKKKFSPPLKKSTSLVDFANLPYGSTFLLAGEIWIKDNSGDQIGISLVNGKYNDNMCGTMVEPVDIEIKWSKKK